MLISCLQAKFMFYLFISLHSQVLIALHLGTLSDTILSCSIFLLRLTGFENHRDVVFGEKAPEPLRGGGGI